MNPEPRAVVRRFLVVLICVDVLLILLNAADRAGSFLQLDQERNFPTWYSSAKLLGVALAALWCASLEPSAERLGLRRWTWPAVALLFTGLSMDETATAHERLASLLMSGSGAGSLRDRLLGGDASKDAFVWPVLFAPAIVLFVYFLATTIYGRLRHDRPNLRLALGGCVAFVGAIVLEGPMVYLSPPVEAWGDAELLRYRLFTLVEESAEVAGATMLLAALLRHAVTLGQARR